MKRYLFVLVSVMLAGAINIWAEPMVWQWSVELPGVVREETGAPARAFLWVPEECQEVRAVVIGTHNMTEETIFENPVFRGNMAEAGVAIIWITPRWDMQWNVANGCQEVFEQMMADLADVSGYDELRVVPTVPLGHSAMATYPWNFAAWNPERTLAVISYHGDAPRTNLTGYGRENLEWGRTRNIDGIPGLMIEGEYEWWESRVNPALAFRMMYPGSCISFLCDAGRGHFDICDRTAGYIALFIRKALKYRTQELKKLDPRDGWLAERWMVDSCKVAYTNRKDGNSRRAKPAPYASYKGNPHNAFWYFDKEMAELTEQIYRQEEGKRPQYIGFVQDGKLVKYNPNAHIKMTADFLPGEDGLTFTLKAVYTDSTRTVQLSDGCGTATGLKPGKQGHAATEPVISRICGPVEKINDTTFRVQFYRMGMNNRRLTNEICLFADSPGDSRYKGAVQELHLYIPFRNTEGRSQTITFQEIADVPLWTTGNGLTTNQETTTGAPTTNEESTAGAPTIRLNATSDCGLPVYYYIKEGPATVEGNILTFTKIPPKSTFPLKVTVVAWQYGLPGAVLTAKDGSAVGGVQTAEPVERSFYITR